MKRARRRITARQLEIVERLSRPGATQSAVAEELGISEQTIKSHLQTVYDRLGVQSFAQAVRALATRFLTPMS